FQAEFLDHEYETYDLLREHLPVARSESMGNEALGGSRAGWVLTRYADAAEVLCNTSDFSSQSMSYPVRPWIPQAVDPPIHTAYRRILNPWFTAEAMSKLEPHLVQYAEELADRMLRKDAFDFVAEFADPFPTVIFCELAGFPASDYPRIMDWKNTIMHASDGHTRGRELTRARARELGLDLGGEDELPAATALAVRAKAAQEVYAYLAKLLAARRAQPQDDLVSRLLAAKVDGERPLTQEELEDTLFLLFMAGLDTVASALGLIVQGLARDEAKRREFVALMEDPVRINPAIEELMRFHSFVLLPRRLTRELSFHGALFRAQEPVLVPTQAANRDGGEFPNPNELDYARSPNRHLGFGLGPHRCLGIHLARRELRIGLQVFHRRLPDYRLDPTRRAVGFGGMKGLASLPLVKA
ncbi:MAG: cytochrome P450, partial [Myxococcota bacterium]